VLLDEAAIVISKCLNVWEVRSFAGLASNVTVVIFSNDQALSGTVLSWRCLQTNNECHGQAEVHCHGIGKPYYNYSSTIETFFEQSSFYPFNYNFGVRPTEVW
jgi:hypothetical protein